MTAFPITREALCTEDSIKYCCACSFMWDGPLQNEEKIDRQPKGTLPYCGCSSTLREVGVPMDEQLFRLRCNAIAIQERKDFGLKMRWSRCPAIMVNRVPNAVWEGGLGTKTVSPIPTKENDEKQPQPSVHPEATKRGLRKAHAGLESQASVNGGKRNRPRKSLLPTARHRDDRGKVLAEPERRQADRRMTWVLSW